MTVATQIKRGNVVVIDKELYRVIKLTHITPGKGNAIVQTDLRNIQTGVKTNKRFRSSEDVQIIDIETRKMQYLYNDENIFHFMDASNYEQIELTRDLLDDAIYYLVPESVYEIDMNDTTPIGIEVPPRVTLKIVETSPSEKGVQGKTKPATLDTGLVIKVPLFIEEGELVIVNTETNEYIERA